MSRELKKEPKKTITAAVLWPSGAQEPTVAPIKVDTKLNDPVVIVWVCSPEVVKFTLTELNKDEFTPTSSLSDSVVFAALDHNTSDAAPYHYRVTATRIDGFTNTNPHDPRIENGGGGGGSGE